MYKRVGEIEFPQPSGVVVNMMPFVFGDPASLPDNLKGWLCTVATTSFASC